MSKQTCDICGRWPRVASKEYGDDYCDGLAEALLLAWYAKKRHGSPF